MRSSDEGLVVFLIGGKGISSGIGDLFHGAGITGVALLDGGDSGNKMLIGSVVSSIGIGGSYCSIDEYSRRCDPQGTRGSGGVATRGGSIGGGLGGVGMNGGANGDGSSRGGDGILGTIGGKDTTSLDGDDGFGT